MFSINSLTSLKIARTALALIDCDGIEVLSTQRLAAELNCEAMSVSPHVPSKGHLLDSVADLLMRELELPVSGETNWLAQLSGRSILYFDWYCTFAVDLVLAQVRGAPRTAPDQP